MKPTQQLHHDGQSLWLDNITRDLLTSGKLKEYIDGLGITGLTSNPTIFDQAFMTTDAYDDAIVDAAGQDLAEEEIFFDLANEGAQPQRLLFASTGTKDPTASDVLYVRALAAPFTVNTMPEKTLLAFGDHGMVTEFLPADSGNAEDVIQRFAAAGVDVDALAARLQSEAADSFVKSWDELLENIGQKSNALMAAR